MAQRKRGGQPGNSNHKDGRVWRQAIKRALARSHGSVDRGLMMIAKKLVEAAEAGDPWALKELADRVEGKAAQVVDMTVTQLTHEDALEALIQAGQQDDDDSRVHH